MRIVVSISWLLMVDNSCQFLQMFMSLEGDLGLTLSAWEQPHSQVLITEVRTVREGFGVFLTQGFWFKHAT